MNIQDLLSPESSGYTVRRQVSRSSASSRRSSVSKPDGLSGTESLQQAIHFLQTGGMADTGNGHTVQDILNDLVEAMRTNVQLAANVKSDVYTKTFKTKVEKIRSIKADLDKLSSDVTLQALAVLNQDDSEDEKAVAETGTGNGALTAALQRRAFLRSQWLSLRRLLFCVDLQLRHAAVHQVFFEESKELRRLLQDLFRQIKVNEKNETIKITPDEYKLMSEYISLLQTNIQDLVGRSLSVVPMHLRKEPVKEPIAARVICSLTSDQIEVHDGDSITILDNSDPQTWKVRHASGAQAHLPAICCVIPSPDKEALLSAARLEKGLVAVLRIYIMTAENWLLRYCKIVLKGILDKKDSLLTRLTSAKQQESTDQLQLLAEVMRELFFTLKGYQDLAETEQDLERAIQKAVTTLIDDPRVQTELSNPIQELMHLVQLLKGLCDKKRQAETVSLSHGLEQYLDEDTLDWVTPLLEGADNAEGLAISIQHQETEIAETSSYTSSSGEVRQTFSIHGVIDPRTDEEISIDEAIKRGILDPDNGMYIHPTEHNRIPIPVAMNAGLIVVESSKTKKVKESVSAVGLVTVNVIRETRPYTIIRIRDPASDEDIPVSEAISKGIFDSDRGIWINSAKKEKIGIKEAIDSGLVIVEYDEEAEKVQPEVTTRTFAVYSAIDQKSGRRLPFHEACQSGIISKEDGEYLDTKTNKRYSVIEAAKNGWIKVRVIEDGAQMEEVLTRHRTDSV
ncbi:hypothetical protein LSH36_241g06023 [Paralvinella palmiformis]|uniref:SH3 domain-containing protein n=1 Tax=Paralvinella palmiformis TaxID=53620 RepID=A0AAD9JLP7_9ANNE|nr:hypothetical protein LSH36_241g06023 [Paralvinella palmiformis]